MTPAQMTPLLAHALPESVGAVPLTLILTVLLAAFLGVNAMGTKRAAALVGAPAAPTTTDEVRPPGLQPLGMILGLILVVGTVALSILGTPDPANNLADTLVLTLGWGAIALTSIAVGPWWPPFNPVNALSRALEGAAGPAPRSDLDPRLRTVLTVLLLLAVAVAQLLLFLTPMSFAIIILVWTVGHALIAGLRGPAWLELEPSNVMATTLGALTPRGIGPLRRLTEHAGGPQVGWVSGTLVAWSLTDLIIATEWWHDLALGSRTQFWVGLEILVGTTVVLGWLINAASRRASLTPALIPVAGAWAWSHYLSILLIDGQGIPIWLSDPFNSGADIFGLADSVVNLEPVPAWLLITLQVVPFVLGHIAGVVIAQRRAAARLSTASQMGPATLEVRALICILLLGGTWMQLAGL